MQAEFYIASEETDFAIAKNLFKEYAAYIGIDLCFQNFETELKNISIQYNKPSGGIILCKINNNYIGCAGIRKLDEETAELKRMYIKPDWQGKGLGKNLIERSIALAKELNYKKLRLDTLPQMQTAIAMYEKSGFYPIGAYYHNPNPGVIFMEKIL